MEQPKPTWICPKCSRGILPEDTVVFGAGLVSHLDCRRPRILGPEERVLLFTYCRNHGVPCATCGVSCSVWELAFDIVDRRTHLCPWCRRDLTVTVREHLYQCVLLPENVRLAAKAARETAAILVKQSRQLSDSAEVLMREAEAAVAALRQTLRKPPARST